MTSGLLVPGGRVQKGGVAGTEGCQVLPPPLQTALSLFMCQVWAGHLGQIREQHTARQAPSSQSRRCSWRDRCGTISIISLIRKWKVAQKLRDGVKRVRKAAVISKRVVRVGLVEKATFKQRLEGGSEPCSFWVPVVQAGGTASTPALRQDCAGSAGRPVRLEWSEQGQGCVEMRAEKKWD